MGATHLNTDAASSAEHPDEDISMQTRFQAPIRHVTPATPEVSVPLNAPPVVTGSHPVISATSTVIIQDGTN
ncbi:MAG: organic solvent tolerance protein OstA, partial [Rothia mucilaginosa]|nr:organic solvent tolerance protein OstA [Rothia mucilaginosa]